MRYVVASVLFIAISISGANGQATLTRLPWAVPEHGTAAERHPQLVTVSLEAGLAAIANEGTSTVTMVDLASREAVADVPVPTGPYSVRFDRDGTMLYVATDRTLSRISIPSLEVVSAHVPACEASTFGGVTGLAVAPDLSSIVVACRTSTDIATVFGTDGLNLVTELPIDMGIKGLEFSPDGRFLYALSQMNSRITKIDWQERVVVAQVAVSEPLAFPWPEFPPGDTSGFVTNKEGTVAYVTGTRSGKIFVVDLVGMTVSKEIGGFEGKGPFGIALSADQSTLLVTFFGSNELGLLDVESEQISLQASDGAQPFGAAFINAEGDAIVSHATSGDVYLVDAE